MYYNFFYTERYKKLYFVCNFRLKQSFKVKSQKIIKIVGLRDINIIGIKCTNYFQINKFFVFVSTYNIGF